MIRINLLPQKKRARGPSVEGEQSIYLGMGAIALVALAVFFLVHRPLQAEIEAQKAKNSKLNKENKAIEKKTKNFNDLKAAFEAAQAQAGAIEQLNNARATPANFLFELATLLRQDGEPSITESMRAALDENENLRWQEGWDPKHVWIDSIEENDGAFKIVGSAQSDGDVTQLAHRLNASVYFAAVQPEGSAKRVDSRTGINFYQFTITGRVRY